MLLTTQQGLNLVPNKAKSYSDNVESQHLKLNQVRETVQLIFQSDSSQCLTPSIENYHWLFYLLQQNFLVKWHLQVILKAGT